MSTSSIDDLLMGSQGNSMQPETPESMDLEGDPNLNDGSEPEEAIYDEPEEKEDDNESQSYDGEVSDLSKHDTDEYGNESEPENKEIRERLKKQAKKFQSEIDDLRQQLSNQGASREVQQAAKDFQYNPDESGDWQQQLASFVKQTVNNMSREQEEAQSREQEHAAQQQFEAKFRDGMGRFDDFREVINELPFQITNPMTLATRGMENPAAFLYAAAKRNPQELERISKIRDPYAQMTEMGKLEERMRKNKPTTKAPRPLSRTHEDSSLPTTKKKTEPTIEDLIAKSDSRKLANMKQRGGRR